VRAHDHRVKRWRHLDLGSQRCFIECDLRRVWCLDCGAQFEAVPWARWRSRYTRDLEDTVAWLAQQMAKTPIAGMLRIAWDSVGRIVERVLADHHPTTTSSCSIRRRCKQRATATGAHGSRRRGSEV
jgi:transposase